MPFPLQIDPSPGTLCKAMDRKEAGSFSKHYFLDIRYFWGEAYTLWQTDIAMEYPHFLNRKYVFKFSLLR